tara:strand:- start:55 stop:396 length:342 start_codon:yes stop_codon:yes gene_type:complete
MAKQNYPLGPPLGGVGVIPGFLTADLVFVIALRIALLADDFACDDADEREPDIELFIVFPYSSAACDCLVLTTLTALFVALIARRIAFDAFDTFCPAERDDDCDFAIVFFSWS